MDWKVVNKADGGHTVINEKIRRILGFTQANDDGTWTAVKMVLAKGNTSEILGNKYSNNGMALDALFDALGLSDGGFVETV
jgi:hypothetical protein